MPGSLTSCQSYSSYHLLASCQCYRSYFAKKVTTAIQLLWNVPWKIQLTVYMCEARRCFPAGSLSRCCGKWWVFPSKEGIGEYHSKGIKKKWMTHGYAQVGSILWPMNLSAAISFSGGLTVGCLLLMDDVKHRHNHHLCLRTSHWDTLRFSKCFSNNKRKCKVNQIVMRDQSPAKREQGWRLK